VVSDDDRLGPTLARVLRRKGVVDVRVVTSSEALAQARPGVADVVLLDLTRGASVDTELCGALAQHAPVILLCSYLSGEQRALARSAGVASIHLKRIGADDLMSRIDAVRTGG